MEFKRDGQKFLSKGMQLSRPVDALAEAKYAILRNVRAYVDGTLHPRLGLSAATAILGTGPVHSIKRFYDSTSITVGELEGSGTALFYNASSIATGFSGNPLSFVPIRPFSAIDNYIYVGDSSKMVKVSKAGGVSNIGILPPRLPVSAALASPSFTAVETFESLPNGWTNGGTAGAIGLLASKRVDTTITHILYDTGSTGWASISPASMAGILPGALLQIAAAEEVRVDRVFNAIATTTIGSIKYDSGSTGLCTIQLASTPLEGLERDAIIRIAAAENVRILSVTTGPDGVPSFRCSTTSTRAAGNAVAGLASFRAYLAGTRAAGNAVTDEAFETSVTVGIGYISKSASYDLSTVSSRPVQPDDEIHLSVRFDKVARLTEGKIMFNVDASTSFDKNYYYYPFTPSSLAPAVKDTLTTLTVQQTIIQRRQITDSLSTRPLALERKLAMLNDPDLQFGRGDPSYEPYPSDFPTGDPTVPGETVTGDSQWTELVFKVRDLIRVGSDESKGLANINALRIQFSVTDTTICDVDSFWIGGTYGLDTRVASESVYPYVWTYLYKSTATGAISNPAPPMRTGLEASRTRVVLTPSYSSDTQVDLIEYYRYGGTLPEWHFVGSSPNSGTFTDSYKDEEISGNFGLEVDNFPPFPVADSPRSGVCNVAGTEVTWVSGDTFNTAWARGSEIVINGVPTSLYNTPISTTQLSLEDNMGTLTNATFRLKSPTIQGVAMAALWGPYSIAGINFMFACKDGSLYFTKGNNPDSAPEQNQIEVTAPQEPLIGGCIYDGQCYIFSTERQFRVIPSLAGDSSLTFEVQEAPTGKGLMVPWGIAVDDLVYIISRDGLYQTNGENVKNITDPDLYSLFPHDGQAGVTVNDVAPPDFTQTANLRLAAGDGLVKFTFRDTGGTIRTLTHDTRASSFSLDTYTPTIVCHYWDEGGSASSATASVATRERVGGSDGRVYTANSGTTDNGTAISSQVRTRSWDMGDTRAQKLFGDIMIDHSGEITVTPGLDNYSSLITTQVLTQTIRGQSVFDILSGGGLKGRNLALDVAFSDPTVVLYEWQPSYALRPEDSKLRWMDFTDGGSPFCKFLQGIVLTADTHGQARAVEVQGDGGIVIATLTVNHDGMETVAYPKDDPSLWTPTRTHLMRLVPSDANQWQIFDVQWIFEQCPENSTRWQNQGTAHEFEDFHHLRRLWIALISSTDVTFTLNGDGTNYTYTIPSTGGVYKKVMIPLQAIKAKLWIYTFTSSAPFRLYLPDSIVEAHEWGKPGLYQNVKPFGSKDYYNWPGYTEAKI